MGSAVRLAPGERRSHRYGVYYIDDCVGGTFAFANSFLLAASEPPIRRTSTGPGFVLTITGDHEVLVDVQAPVIGPRGTEE